MDYRRIFKYRRMAYEIKADTYNIYINQSQKLQLYMDKLAPSKVFVIVDQFTEQFCLHAILEILPLSSVIIQIDAGEKYKNIETCSFVWKSLLNNGADRHSLVLNLGGGVIGDLGGFCAATFMRGIPFIHLPTTLLSQVDSSCGAKLGIDFETTKNIIGVFEQPLAVFIDTQFLKTLPYKQMISGYAELLKHGLIADEKLWQYLSSVDDIRAIDYEDIIKQSIDIKNQIVLKDPKEKDLRKTLNFGHTIGHAIESLLVGGDKELLHGEAVAIGMICESYMAYLKGFIPLEDASQIKKNILKIFGNKYKSIPDFSSILNTMKFDKKNKGGQILFSLLEKIGKGNFNIAASEDEILSSLNWYLQKD